MSSLGKPIGWLMHPILLRDQLGHFWFRLGDHWARRRKEIRDKEAAQRRGSEWSTSVVLVADEYGGRVVVESRSNNGLCLRDFHPVRHHLEVKHEVACR